MRSLRYIALRIVVAVATALLLGAIGHCERAYAWTDDPLAKRWHYDSHVMEDGSLWAADSAAVDASQFLPASQLWVHFDSTNGRGAAVIQGQSTQRGGTFSGWVDCYDFEESEMWRGHHLYSAEDSAVVAAATAYASHSEWWGTVYVSGITAPLMGTAAPVWWDVAHEGLGSFNVTDSLPTGSGYYSGTPWGSSSASTSSAEPISLTSWFTRSDWSYVKDGGTWTWRLHVFLYQYDFARSGFVKEADVVKTGSLASTPTAPPWDQVVPSAVRWVGSDGTTLTLSVSGVGVAGWTTDPDLVAAVMLDDSRLDTHIPWDEPGASAEPTAPADVPIPTPDVTRSVDTSTLPGWANDIPLLGDMLNWLVGVGQALGSKVSAILWPLNAFDRW